MLLYLNEIGVYECFVLLLLLLLFSCDILCNIFLSVVIFIDYFYICRFVSLWFQLLYILLVSGYYFTLFSNGVLWWAVSCVWTSLVFVFWTSFLFGYLPRISYIFMFYALHNNNILIAIKFRSVCISAVYFDFVSYVKFDVDVVVSFYILIWDWIFAGCRFCVNKLFFFSLNLIFCALFFAFLSFFFSKRSFRNGKIEWKKEKKSKLRNNIIPMAFF